MQSVSSSASAGRRPWRRVHAVTGAVLALAGAAAALGGTGSWSSEPAGPAGAARPVGAAVAVDGPTVTIVGAGDILPHRELWSQARRDGGGRLDFTTMLAGVRPTVSGAHLALCHLAAPLAPDGGPHRGVPRLSAPPEVAQAIRATGYDGCSAASHQSLDRGEEGVTHTVEALERAGLRHAGTRSGAAAQRPALYKVAGVTVAHLSYTQGLGGPEKVSDRVAVIEERRIAADAKAARGAGAQIVVVSVDWGAGHEHEPDVHQQEAARQIATVRDVDVVFGQHAHVVQAAEKVNEKWIFYGMGDHLSRHDQPVNRNREGVMVRLTFTPARDGGRWTIAAAEALPTFIDLNPDIRVVDVERALADPALSPGRRRIYEAAADRVKGHLSTRGAVAAGLVIRGVTSG